MYITLCSLLLASTGLAVGQNCPGQSCPGGSGYSDFDDGYGRYGTWGGYGGYAPRTFAPSNCGNLGCGMGMGMGMGTGTGYPMFSQNVFPGAPLASNTPSPATLPSTPPTAPASDNVLDKYLVVMKEALSAYQQKLKDLEKKLEEADRQTDKLADLQTKQFEMFEKKLAESQAKILISIQEFHTKVQETRPDSAVSVQLKVLNERIEKLASSSKEVSSPRDTIAIQALEKHIELLEKLLKDTSGNQQLVDGLTAISIALKDGKSQAPNLHKYALPIDRGLIIVNLPADARLYLDGLLSATGTNVRTFISPPLEAGKSYFYTLRVELERNGKVYTETQKIYFQPGREARVSFDHLEPTLPVILNKKND